MSWLKGWKKRVQIKTHPDVVDSDLVDFPVLIRLSPSSGRNHQDVTFVFDELQSNKNRKKIAVTLANGITQCYVEIESWDHSKEEARLWVKVPRISSTIATILYLYFDRNQQDNAAYVGDVDSEAAQNVWDSFELVDHLRANRSRTTRYFRYQKMLLELIFPRDWFRKTKRKKHPAFARWDLCNRMIKHNGIIKFPEQENEIVEIGRVILDSWILSKITGSDMKNFILGVLHYGNEAVQKKISSRILNGKQFEDIMVELSMGAWHLNKGHKVTPLEEKGLPDLKVEFPDVVYPAFIECKHLRSRTKRRITDIVRKANNQIKKIGHPCYGVVIIDANIPVAADTVNDDRLPTQVPESVENLRSALSGNKNTSVGAGLLTWDDNMILGRPPMKETLVALRRRFIRINHTNPVTVVPTALPLFNGWDVEFFLTWSQRIE